MSELYRFPLKQSVGIKAVPCVIKGDDVHRGQPLAFQGNGLGCGICSSVTGQIHEVTEDEITVEASPEQDRDYVRLKSTEPLDLIREAGIVGLGGAGFPTWAKLAKPFDGSGTVIVNAAECEPILDHNLTRIRKNPEQLLRGLDIAMELVHAEHGIIAIKGIHKETIALLKEKLKNPRVKISLLENVYPAGEERAIVRDTMGVLLPPTALPSEAGAVVINAESCCRIEEAVDQKKPMIDKDLTVAGKIRGNEQDKLIQVFLDVPVGTPVRSFFERAGGKENHGLADTYGELIMGGPFTGHRTDLDAPVLKTTGGLIAAECFPKGPEKIGLLVCACGADEARLREIAKSMGSEVVGVAFCKQAEPVKNTRKCQNPGHCPGQVEKIMKLKKAGAQAVLISNCTDCTNTVMACAPKLGLPVYHCTDGALRAVNMKLIRRFKG